MEKIEKLDVIIIGGSYSGLSAALALGRSLRKVLVIDAGKPCNRQTPHSHNFLTRDGETPSEIAALAKRDLAAYPTVQLLEDTAIDALKTDDGFEILTHAGKTFAARKLIFAAGIKDQLPAIKGFAECWGISAIHCPYCHGYEVRGHKTGILANGETAFELAKLVSNWTLDLRIFSNGKANFTPGQLEKLAEQRVEIVEKEITAFEHENGYVKALRFADGTSEILSAVYARPAFVQHSELPRALGCGFTEPGHIRVDAMQKTTVPGVFASGDSVTPMRSVAAAVYTGSMAGASANRELIEEAF